MITKITGEQPFQVLTNNFSISPSNEGYTLQISADGKNFSNLFSVGAGVTRLVTGVAANSYYRLLGNESEVSVNWMKTCVTEGGGGAAGNELVPQDSLPATADPGTVVALTSGGVYQYDGTNWIDVGAGADLSAYWTSAQTQSAITEAVSGKADAKIVIDFDHTTQAERASVYADLYALYSGGSGATINKTYDFYKTVNTWQGLKIDYYGFSGDTLVFGKVVSPENIEDQVVYEQVMTIDSEGNVEVVTNIVGGVDLSAYYTSAQTEDAITSRNYVTSAQVETQILDKNYITAEDIEPDVIYEAEGNDPGFYAINSSALTTWQIENLDLSPYQFVRFYIKASDIGFNSGDNFTAPMYVDVVLDPKSLSSQYEAYLGVTTNICAGNRNRSFHTIAAVDITKSKVQLLYETSLWDISVSSAANNGRYCYKIEGYRYNVCGTGDNGGGGGSYTAGPNIDISPAGVISVSGLSTINGSAITEGGNIVIESETSDPTILKSVQEFSSAATDGDVQSKISVTPGLPSGVTFVTGNTYGPNQDQYGGTLTIPIGFAAGTTDQNPIYLMGYTDGMFDTVHTLSVFENEWLTGGVVLCQDNEMIISMGPDSDSAGESNYGNTIFDYQYTAPSDTVMVVNIYADVSDPTFDVPQEATVYDGLYVKSGNTWMNIMPDTSEFITSAYTGFTPTPDFNALSAVVQEQQIVFSSGYNELHTQVIELSGRPTPDMTQYTPTSGFATINGSAITNGGNIVIQGGSGGGGGISQADLASSGYLYYQDDGMGNIETNLDNTYDFLKGNYGDGFPIDPPRLVDYDGYDGNTGTAPFPKHLVAIYQSDYDDLVNDGMEDGETFYIVLPDPE